MLATHLFYKLFILILLAKNIFGMGDLKCVANPSFVERFCGTIAAAIYRCVSIEEGEERWAQIFNLACLENARGVYADLNVTISQQ